MADDRPPWRDACDTLLDFFTPDADEALAKAPGVQHPEPQFHELIRLEVIASMAMERLLAAHVLRVLPIIETLPDSHGEHALQAVINTLVGMITGFQDDMPPSMHAVFLARLNVGLKAALAHREYLKAKRDKEAGRAARH